MNSVFRILLSTLIGAVVCAVIGFIVFFILTSMDGTDLEEALFSSLLVSFICAIIGAAIGCVVGIFDLDIAGGSVAGFLFTAAVIAFYVFSSGSIGRFGYFLSESKVFFVVLILPTVLDGLNHRSVEKSSFAIKTGLINQAS